MNPSALLRACAAGVALALSPAATSAQENASRTDAAADPLERRHWIGSSAFLLGNLSTKDAPHFVLLNYGFRLGRKSAVFAEAITWTYYEPLGSYGSSNRRYPGKIKSFGVGVGYQRFFWRSAYMTAQATPFLQQFLETGGRRINTGFQLYLQSRAGYRFEFSSGRWFLEPSASFNYWPINTGFPESFKQVEAGRRNYFLFEPGLHFGRRF